MDDQESKKGVNTHKAMVRSLRSLSESSKKRDTTSTTNSGLLSSCSCWSWLNWPSKNPFWTKTAKYINSKAERSRTTKTKHQEPQAQKTSAKYNSKAEGAPTIHWVKTTNQYNKNQQNTTTQESKDH